MHAVGRERRRKGPVNRVRRFLYGLLLAASAPGAMAADELAALGQHRPPAHSATAATPQRAAVLATLQGLIMIHAESASAAEEPLHNQAGYPRIALDTVTARVQHADDAPLFRVSVRDLPSIRDGVGFDLAVPDLGNFHLNLHARRNARPDRRRSASAGEQAPVWSLGGTLELVRVVDGARHVAFVPELLFDPSRQEESYLPFQASLRLAHWRSLAEKHALDDRVPQLTFRWRL
jgi:hypothetical protein